MSVTAAPGFEASGVACGIKASGAADLALVAVSPGPDGVRVPVPAAAVFTRNRAAAAPVLLSRSHLAAAGGRAGAVVLNSGNANAATGEKGAAVAAGTARAVGAALGLRPEEVLVCSTGLIGIPLALEPIERALPALVAGLGGSAEAGLAAARAIMTTDTVPRQTVLRGDGFTVGGMAKGAAMLAPNMATMLAVLTTDAAASPEELAAMLGPAVDRSFNALSVDGSCSTNDAVIVLAGGRAGPVAGEALAGALAEACGDLAAQMAADAEGATKVARITVRGAASAAEAARGARRVAESQLVQCSLHGADPYWGRIVSELGSAGIGLDMARLAVSYGGVVVCAGGVAAAHDVQAVAAHMAGRQVEIVADLGLGVGEASMLTTDLSHAYIDENMRTS